MDETRQQHQQQVRIFWQAYILSRVVDCERYFEGPDAGSKTAGSVSRPIHFHFTCLAAGLPSATLCMHIANLEDPVLVGWGSVAATTAVDERFVAGPTAEIARPPAVR